MLKTSVNQTTQLHKNMTIAGFKALGYTEKIEAYKEWSGYDRVEQHRGGIYASDDGEEPGFIGWDKDVFREMMEQLPDDAE